MKGWEDDDEITITFRSLKQGIQEAVNEERERIIELLFTEWADHRNKDTQNKDLMDGFGMGIENAIIRIIGKDAYLERLFEKAKQREES